MRNRSNKLQKDKSPFNGSLDSSYELDYRDLAKEEANRTIYIATTGNDSTGDGSSGAPFLTINRALLDIKPFNEATITVSFDDGTYTLANDLFIRDYGKNAELKFETTNSGFSVVEASSTFTSNDGFTYNNTAKTWTVDEHKGRFIRVISMVSGTLPTGNSAYIPILSNTATALELSGAYYNNYNAYEIVECDVEIAHNSNNIFTATDSNSYLQFNRIEFSGTGGVYCGCDTIIPIQQAVAATVFNACHIENSKIRGERTFLNNCFLDCSERCHIRTLTSCVINSSTDYILTNYADNERSAYFSFGYGNYKGVGTNTLFLGDGSVKEYDSKYSNFKVLFYKMKELVMQGDFIFGSNVKFMAQILPGITESIISKYGDLYGGYYSVVFTGAPTTAYLTKDGSTAFEQYINLDESINAGLLSDNYTVFTENDIEITDKTKGIVMTTPDGTKRYRINIDNAGALVTTLI